MFGSMLEMRLCSFSRLISEHLQRVCMQQALGHVSSPVSSPVQLSPILEALRKREPQVLQNSWA